MIESKPAFLQGVFTFEGAGYDKPTVLSGASYAVPSDKRGQLVYLRAGNSSAEMVYLSLLRDGKVMRYFPLAAKGATHVPLVVTEDLFPESRLDIVVGAPAGTSGTVVIDMGVVEI